MQLTGGIVDGDLKIKTALVSVYDKTGLVEFAGKLSTFGVSLIATGGTCSLLQESGIKVNPLESVAHFPEMLDGRVKTLQPEIFAGILARKSSVDHMKQIREKGISTIDMVVCNFYSFETAAEQESSDEKLIELIDIGGPSMARAAAKNFESVCVVPSKDSYSDVVSEIESKGMISLETRRTLALRAFEIVAEYDVRIYNTLFRRFPSEGEFPGSFFLSARKFESPKYGQNPGQKAMIYSINGARGGMPEWSQLFGDLRSYNNYLDIGGSYEILVGFEDHSAAATVKHGQISGFAFSTSLSDAYRLAHECDPEADFGNTTVLNRTVDVETAKLIGRKEGVQDGSVYTEIVLAPGYEPEALEILKQKQKKKMRIIHVTKGSTYEFDLRVIQGLAMLQEAPDYTKKLSASKVTVESIASAEKKDLVVLLGLWEVVRRVESNAIVIGNGRTAIDGHLERLWTLGVGSFRKRNGATKIALDNAGERAKGAFCASDGFFPFPDSIELLGKAGIKGIIQPGGSINDRKVVSAADAYAMSMLFTHERAFKH